MTQHHHRPGHALIDWLGVSIPEAYHWPSTSDFTRRDITPLLVDLFGIDPATAKIRTSGANWYRNRHTITTPSGAPLVHIYTEPTAEQNRNTTAISITGYALSSRPDALHALDPVELVRKVDALGGNLTRFDGALDTFDGKPTLALMLEAAAPDAWRDRTVTSLCRTSKPVGIWDESLYFGHLDKGIVINAYNKAKQTGVDFPWFRLEFRTKDRDLLKTIKEEIIAGRSVGELTAGLLSQYLRFVPPGLRSKYNRPTCSWWSELVAEGAGFELKRHSSGKVDDEPRKQPNPDTVTRYLLDVLKLDDSGAIGEAVLRVASQIHMAKALAAFGKDASN